MSHPSSILNALREVPTAGAIRAEHQIDLVDQEHVPAPGRVVEPQSDDPGRNDSAATASQPSTPGPSPLVKKLTSNSLQVKQDLKRKFTERKYAKFAQDRYDLQEEELPPDEDPARQPQHGEPASTIQTNYLERSKVKAKALWKRKKGLGKGKDTGDTVVDILYENQRGMFVFGVPKYSASSLLPSDPMPWQNAQLRTSPVDIRNAQVPDPSWEWTWKSWYVDMSRDVDEEGWEYSLKFKGSSSWHGNHPWFHSFVRRRRWLRMRRRKDVHHHTKEKSHELTPEYFTIHPTTLRPASEDLSRIASTDLERLRRDAEVEPPVEEMEITNMSALLLALKKSSVDREKLVAMRKFAKEGADELYYLPDHMSNIMGLFVFQSSRRQLLADLLHHFDEARERLESLGDHSHDDEDGQREHDVASRQASNLMRAVEAADDQVKRLEYWSDIKGMIQDGETLQDTEEGTDRWDKSRWAGLRSSNYEQKEAFASKQDADAGAPRLHQHAEHSEHVHKGKGRNEVNETYKKAGGLLLDIDAQRHPKISQSKDSKLEKYTKMRKQGTESDAQEKIPEPAGHTHSEGDERPPTPPSPSNINLTVEQTLHDDDLD